MTSLLIQMESKKEYEEDDWSEELTEEECEDEEDPVARFEVLQGRDAEMSLTLNQIFGNSFRAPSCPDHKLPNIQCRNYHRMEAAGKTTFLVYHLPRRKVWSQLLPLWEGR